MLRNKKDEKGGNSEKPEFTQGQKVLKAILTHQNCNSNELARRLNLNRAQVFYDIEDGTTKNISSQLAIRLADSEVLKNISLRWLLTGDGEMFNIEVKGKVDSKSSVNSGRQDSTRTPVLQRLLSIQEELRQAIEELQEVQHPAKTGTADKEIFRQVHDKLKRIESKKGTKT